MNVFHEFFFWPNEIIFVSNANEQKNAIAESSDSSRNVALTYNTSSTIKCVDQFKVNNSEKPLIRFWPMLIFYTP